MEARDDSKKYTGNIAEILNGRLVIAPEDDNVKDNNWSW